MILKSFSHLNDSTIHPSNLWHCSPSRIHTGKGLLDHIKGFLSNNYLGEYPTLSNDTLVIHIIHCFQIRPLHYKPPWRKKQLLNTRSTNSLQTTGPHSSIKYHSHTTSVLLPPPSTTCLPPSITHGLSLSVDWSYLTEATILNMTVLQKKQNCLFQKLRLFLICVYIHTYTHTCRVCVCV